MEKKEQNPGSGSKPPTEPLSAEQKPVTRSKNATSRPEAKTRRLLTELVKVIPTILWILFVSIVLGIFYEPIRYELIPRISGLKVAGIEATFIMHQLNEASADSLKAPYLTEQNRSQIVARAERLAPVLEGKQILWIDDNPGANIHERRILRSLGIFVDLARSNEEAHSFLQETKYDIVISDISRNGNREAGIQFLNEMREDGIFIPTIFYILRYDPGLGKPDHAFAITNLPHHLLNNIFDVFDVSSWQPAGKR